MIINNDTLIMTRGDTESISVQDPAGPLESGDTVLFTVRIDPTDPVARIGKTVTEFTDGAAAVSLSSGDTVGLYPGIYLYDIRVYKAAGAVRTLRKGALVIEAEISRPEDGE